VKFYLKCSVGEVPRLHRCDMCNRRFPANQIGRIQIVKRLPKGKVEFWICKACAPRFMECVKPLIPHIEWEPKSEKREE